MNKNTTTSTENLYHLNGKISVKQAIPFGLQHILAMFVANIAPIFIVAAASGLSTADSASLIQSAMLIAGIGTLIQLFPIFKIGSGLPIVMGISFTFVSVFCYLGPTYGYNAIVGAVLVGGIIFQGYSAISVSEDKGKVNPIFLNAVQMFFGGLLIYMIGLGTEGYHSFIGKPSGFYISLGILVFISVFAFSFWFIALQSKGAKVSDINMCRLINPILGAVLSWVMLPDEYPTFSTVAGMIIIVSSLIIYFKGAEISQWLKNKTAKVS